MIHCPSHQQLDRLLREELTAGEGEALATHIEECAQCQEVLERLSRAGANTDGSQAETEDRPGGTDEEERFLQRLKAQGPPSKEFSQTRMGGLDGRLTAVLAPPQAADELGRLGKYRILKILGAGGMGVVYQAEDPLLKRSVALKVLRHTQASSSHAGRRFLHEARAMAAVEHDHIVRIYEAAEDRSVPFLAMELLRGESLEMCLEREK